MTLANLPILDVWRALGGGELRGRRGQAFWRGGDSYSVSLDSKREMWHDFRDGLGGGAISLVETVLGCTRPAALAWLETQCGLDPRVALSEEQRRVYARAKAEAPALARRLADFACGLEIITARYLAAASTTGSDPQDASKWHQQAYLLRRASGADIAQLWQSMSAERENLETLGKSDREHAEAVTWQIVDLLTAKESLGWRAA
jgi:hypothetical protein